MEVMNRYLATFTPMRAGKIRLALERQMRLNGRILFRWQAAEELAVNPHLRLDAEKGRLYTSDDGRFFSVAGLTGTLVAFVMWLKEQRLQA